MSAAELCLDKVFSGQNDSGHGVSFCLPPGWDQNLPTVGTDGLPFSGPSRSSPQLILVDWFDESTTAIGTSNDGGFEATATTATSEQRPQVGVQDRERLTMDTKWIPAMPRPSYKQWVSRSRELSGFRDWAEKLGGWLCLIHDRYGPELREALRMNNPLFCKELTRSSEQGDCFI